MGVWDMGKASLHVRYWLSSEVRHCAAMFRGVAQIAIACASIAIFSSVSFATETWQEYQQLIGKSQSIGAMGVNLFGEEVDIYTGRTSFVVTDVSLPGNSTLPVALTRRIDIEVTDITRDGPMLDGMLLDVPKLSGTFAVTEDLNTNGWVVNTAQPLNRCSIGLGQVEQARPRNVPIDSVSYFSPVEFWHGYQMHIPGEGVQEMLVATASSLTPSDATYPWVTKNGWALRCIPLQIPSQGQGFVAVSPDGLKYTFDKMVAIQGGGGLSNRLTRVYTLSAFQRHGCPEGELPNRIFPPYANPRCVDNDLYYEYKTKTHLPRQRVLILGTKVEDRFGNWVQYVYDANNRLTRIHANDGRDIVLTYNGNPATVVTATAAGQTWTYSSGNVQLPDGSSWIYGPRPVTTVEYWDPEENGLVEPCGTFPLDTYLLTGGPSSYTITHPSGAVGTFDFQLEIRARSHVQYDCLLPPDDPTAPGVLWQAKEYPVIALKGKTIAGPGLPTNGHEWAYEYEQVRGSFANASFEPCYAAGCPTQVWTKVLDPDGAEHTYTFGNKFNENESHLLSVVTTDDAGRELNRVVNTYVTPAQAGTLGFSDMLGISPQPRGAALMTSAQRPRISSVITRQGVNFTSTTNQFDAFKLARPTIVTKSSTVSGNPSRTETIVYEDNLGKWVLGQVKSVTCTASNFGSAACGSSVTPMSDTTYDSTWATPLVSKQFGKVVTTLTYDTVSAVGNPQRGTIKTVADGNGNLMTLSNWKRGIPQGVQYPGTPEAPAGATRSATVNDSGWITSVTDENSFVTNYQYDAMGRVTKIDFQAETAFDWLDRNSSFLPTTAGDWKPPGVATGQWRHSVSAGNYRKFTYFDSLWRPIITSEYDISNQAATLRVVNHAYDHDGKVIFTSYPSGAFGSTVGTRSEYDALGRATKVEQDSELGPLITTTQYLHGFQTRVIPPRGVGSQTTTSYRAWDQPTTDLPVSIAHPEGAFTDIARDVFGKPTSITRRNSTGSVSLSRTYTYGGQQMLCTVTEPETGSTVHWFDGAGNLVRTAGGLAIAPGTSCADAKTQGLASGRSVLRTYDARNRVKTLVFPDGKGNQAWTYEKDGLPSLVSTNNSNGGDVVTNNYYYNKRRLLTEERFGVNGKLWNLTYDYNPLGTLSSYNSPGGAAISFAPDAIGQPTQAGTYATAVAYFPNGGIKQFTYGNGIKHTLTQNARGLPDTSCDFAGASCTSSAVLNDGYDYDPHGNVMGISDGRTGARGHRDMSYDALDRLTQTDSPMFGSAKYVYDVLDNLKTVHVSAGPRTRNHNYTYDANNRLTNVTNAIGGATVVGLGYDVQGNLANKNGVLYGFDYGNRLREVTGVEQYRYDGHGRRVMATREGLPLYSVYGQDGVLRFQHDERSGKTTDYVYLGGSLVAQVETAVPLAPPALTVPAYSANGAYTVSWTASPTATKYQLQEQLGGGGWSTIHDAAGASKAISGKAAGVWNYQIRACTVSTCGNWSPVSSIHVQTAPTGIPILTVPAIGPGGNYNVEWTPVSGATSYQVEEQQGSGSWTQIHNAAGTTKARTGRATGAWNYRVRACNASGCGGWSATGTVQSLNAPSGAPTLTAPATNTTGSYSPSWTTVATSDRYELQEQFNSGSWISIHDAPGTSKALTGKTTGSWGYRVRACNGAGCSAYTAEKVVAVTLVPDEAPALSVPDSSYAGNFNVSWSAVTHATSYQLQERLGTGSWSAVHDADGTTKAISGKTTGSWSYQVRACNSTGCSGWSTVKIVAVTLPPTGVTTVTAPGSNTTGSYNISWTSVATATEYEVEQRMDAGAWGKIHDATTLSMVLIRQPQGTYDYRARGCNEAGCANWSSLATTVVTPQLVAPDLTTPAEWILLGESYGLEWTDVFTATRYEVERRIGAGSWTEIYDGPGLIWSETPSSNGFYHHRVRACRADGCGPYSGTVTVSVTTGGCPTCRPGGGGGDDDGGEREAGL